ncbi:hypothetical protein H2203_006683 [Taxawa tesnikishii (nom. ined.)]|nr:hypothetical protein H2203_006683 [Dothideales sp. JES 119]
MVPGSRQGIVRLCKPGQAVFRGGRSVFTRQVSVPIDITVNASVQLHRVDVANFPSDFAWSNQHRQRLLDSADGDEKPRPRRSLSRPIERGGSRFKALLERVGVASDDESHYLLLLDIRNAWPSPLSVSIDVREPPSPSSTDIDTDTEDWKRAYTVRDVIHPGHIARLVLLLPRLYLPNPHAPIPVLSRKNERQFVVSTDVFSPAAERAARESFWFREAILKRLRGVWKEENSEREGEIALRGIRLAPRMVEGVRLRNLSIELSITGSDPSASPTDGEEGEADKDREHAASGITQLGHARYSAPVAVPLILRARIRNRSASTPIRGILRLQPRLSNQLSAAALDVGKRLMWTGLLQRPLPALQPGQTISADLGIVVLAKGDFEVGALVEEVRVAEVGKGGAAGEEDGGDGAEDMEGRGLWEGMERRVWCAREPCTIHAKDAKGI